MAHPTKEKTESGMNKTFVFKSTCNRNEIDGLWRPAMEEYCRYYNGVSKWIADNLTTMRIGDLAGYIDNHESKYYLAVTNEKKRDLPLYRLFMKGFDSMNADNAIFCIIKKVNPENYSGNILGMSESDYRRMGYVQSVIGNFRTKMTSLKTGVGRKWFDPDNVDDETLELQTIYEVGQYGIESVEDFRNLLDNLKTRESTPELQNRITRLSKIFEYYSENRDKVTKRTENLAVENLKEFGGCVRKSMTSMTLHKKGSVIDKEGNTSFVLNLVFNRKPYPLRLLGNRQVVKFTDGKREDIIDITGKHGDLLTFTLKGNELFTHISVPIVFEKEIGEIRNVVGIDVNIKHMMLNTSIRDDGNLKGYINLYRELLNDSEFISTFGDSATGKEELGIYMQMAESVNFGILETESLFERYVKQTYGSESDNRLIRRELAMQKVFDRIVRESDDIYITDYVNYVRMLRAKYKAYYVLKMKYYEKQAEYDKEMGFTDISTDSKETMDKRRFENPFVDTETAKGILVKLRNVEQDIVGCRDNIIRYAFRIFTDNGFDTLALEYLDSSQMKKMRMRGTESLLYKLDGKTRDEVESEMKKLKVAKSNFRISYGSDEKVDKVEYTNEGEKKQMKLKFMNLIIKAIHFADVKDKFIQLSNNNSMNIVLCPSAFTSQMDSITHKLYYILKKTTKKNGKETLSYVLADKKTVRTRQERHINGLNADFNAACNMEYIALDDTLRDKMTDRFRKTRDIPVMYGLPAWNIKKSFKKNLSMKTIETFRQNGNVAYGIVNEDGLFQETSESEKR